MPTSQAGSTHYTLHCATSTIRQQVWSRCSMQIIPIHTSSALRIIPTWEIIMNNLFVQPLWVKYQHLPHFIGEETEARRSYIWFTQSHTSEWMERKLTLAFRSIALIWHRPPCALTFASSFCSPVPLIPALQPHKTPFPLLPTLVHPHHDPLHLRASPSWSSSPSHIPLCRISLSFPSSLTASLTDSFSPAFSDWPRPAQVPCIYLYCIFIIKVLHNHFINGCHAH